MKRNKSNFDSLSSAGALLILFGKLFVCASTSLLFYIIISSRFRHDLYSSLLPMIFVIYASYNAGSIFMSIYGTSADTILQSYCLEEELRAEM